MNIYNFREAVLYMFSQMDKEFQRNHEILIKRELSRYPCIVLMREDLSGYLKDGYKGIITKKQKEGALNYIDSLNDDDLENIALDLQSDPMMESFWAAIDFWFDNLFERGKIDDYFAKFNNNSQ